MRPPNRGVQARPACACAGGRRLPSTAKPGSERVVEFLYNPLPIAQAAEMARTNKNQGDAGRPAVGSGQRCTGYKPMQAVAPISRHKKPPISSSYMPRAKRHDRMRAALGLSENFTQCISLTTTRTQSRRCCWTKLLAKPAIYQISPVSWHVSCFSFERRDRGSPSRADGT